MVTKAKQTTLLPEFDDLNITDEHCTINSGSGLNSHISNKEHKHDFAVNSASNMSTDHIGSNINDPISIISDVNNYNSSNIAVNEKEHAEMQKEHAEVQKEHFLDGTSQKASEAISLNEAKPESFIVKADRFEDSDKHDVSVDCEIFADNTVDSDKSNLISNKVNSNNTVESSYDINHMPVNNDRNNIDITAKYCDEFNDNTNDDHSDIQNSHLDTSTSTFEAKTKTFKTDDLKSDHALLDHDVPVFSHEKDKTTFKKNKEGTFTLDELDASNFDLADLSVGDLASPDLSKKLQEKATLHDRELEGTSQLDKNQAPNVTINDDSKSEYANDTSYIDSSDYKSEHVFENGVQYGAELTVDEIAQYQKLSLNEGDTCPHCNAGILVVRTNDRMAFLGCSNFPSCKFRYYSKHLNHVVTLKTLVSKCPSCNDSLAVKKGRFGLFIGCSNYPECSYIYKEENLVEESFSCPECKTGHLNQRRSRSGKIFYGCDSFPKCSFSVPGTPLKESCPACQFPLLFLKKMRRRNKVSLIKLCPNKDCVLKQQKAQLAKEKSLQKAQAASLEIEKEIALAKGQGLALKNISGDAAN